MSFFSIHELHQPAGFGLDDEDYPVEWVADPTRWPALRDALDTIRVAVGSPLRVKTGGGYRSIEYNKRMYDARKQKPTDSQHSQGRAADIYSTEMTAAFLHDIVIKLYKSGSLWIGGLGLYDTFIHVDVRVGWDHLAAWNYSTKHEKNL